MMFRKILVAHDGSDGARKAFKAALKLAAEAGAEVQTISVIERHSRIASTAGEVMEENEEERKHYSEVESEVKNLAGEARIQLKTTIVVGHEVETIVHFLRDGHFDLLVLGFMGHSKILGRIWGSTSQKLTEHAPCSVLVVK